MDIGKPSELSERMDDIIVGWSQDGKAIKASSLTCSVFEVVEEAIEAGRLVTKIDLLIRGEQKL